MKAKLPLIASALPLGIWRHCRPIQCRAPGRIPVRNPRRRKIVRKVRIADILRYVEKRTVGYEHNTYYFNRSGDFSHEKKIDSVIVVESVEHDVYGNPHFTAIVLDLAGAKELLPKLRGRNSREISAIEDAIGKADPS